MQAPIIKYLLELPCTARSNVLSAVQKEFVSGRSVFHLLRNLILVHCSHELKDLNAGLLSVWGE